MASATATKIWEELAGVDRTLKEHEETGELTLRDRAIRSIRNEINEEQTRLEIIEHRNGRVRLRATSHVGIVSIPDGPTIEIRPKARGTNLLGLLQYANGVEATTIERVTSLTEGSSFVEALASLYQAELEATLSQGLHRDYRRREEAVGQLRGRLDVHRQLQRQGPTPTKFECTFDELTADTTVNRGILYATALLATLVQDRQLSQSLDRHQQQLRRRVTLTPIRPVHLEGIELTRLASHYTDLLRLTKLVLRGIFVEELRSGTRSSFALLVNMNDVFESTIERAATEAVSDREGWTVKAQASSQTLVSGGKRQITIQPDVLVRDGKRRPRLVGDAKWKLDKPAENDREPSNSDIYQMVAYEVAHGVSGMLFYPSQANRVSSEYAVSNLYPLRTVEVPISAERSDCSTVADAIRTKVSEEIDRMLGQR